MEADIQKFTESLQDRSKEELIGLCAGQKRDICALENAMREYRASDTAMARDHQRALQRINGLEPGLKNLKKAFEHVRAQNELLARHRFCAHNEKPGSLHAGHDGDILDPISEDQDPEGRQNGDGGARKEKPAPSPAKEMTEEEKSRANEDRRARAEARRLAGEALGDGRTKKTPTKMDSSRLPHTSTYDIDIEELDRRYGKDGWEIVSWHKKELVHRPIATHYVETRYTPVIRGLGTGKLSAAPQKDILLKGSPVTPGLLAFIIYEKYFKSVPLYRQSADLENLGIVIPRQDMSNWIIRFSEECLSVPYYYMQKLQCACRYGQCDETTLQVLHEEGRDARTKSYVWVHTTGELSGDRPIVVLAYEPTRGTDHLRDYYAGFSGTLSSDAYGAYFLLEKESGGKVVISGCLMHARRRFAEALEIIRLGKLTREQIEALPEYKALALLGKVYSAEGELRSLTPEERLESRKSTVEPLVDEFYAFIESPDRTDPLMSEKMKDAISYSLAHKESLCRFLSDGRVPCDNGFAENAIRLYAQGRRNWLFSNTPAGAWASTAIYSLIETARRNTANPLIYIKYLLEKTPLYLELPSGSPRLEELMPWSDTYRSYEESEKQRSAEMFVPESQKRPYYRPWQDNSQDKAKKSQLAAS